MTTTITDTRPASYKQRMLICRLAGERPDWTDRLNGADWERCFDVVADGSKFVSITEAGRVIDALFTIRPTAPKAGPVEGKGDAGAARNQAIEPGVYVVGDAIIKVQENRDHSGVYAKRWVEIGGTRLTEVGEFVEAEWTYEQGLIGRIAPDHRMTVDEAKAFTIRYGRCVACGRGLKAGESVERGIGPVCIKTFRHS